ncbi:DUF6491 family protein [Sphingomonas sp. LHG3406-1]|uniref:DUF6491 family protein n=1 Tax=Sphingomonas sp. LHG3406-1 TaxID=2804617 RepID=UPI0026355D49|nr:DUF6491 family protein [Sphingomonas sp. LHG3406-1]
MRRLTIASLATLAAAGTLASCATNGQPPARSAAAQQELSRWLDGRVVGRPQSCLPTFRNQDMTIIDESTILFRDGANRVWRNDVNGPCSGLGRPGTALVTRQTGSQLCRGEIAQVVDTSTGFIVGSCSLGDFVPYTGPRRR